MYLMFMVDAEVQKTCLKLRLNVLKHVKRISMVVLLQWLIVRIESDADLIPKIVGNGVTVNITLDWLHYMGKYDKLLLSNLYFFITAHKSHVMYY